MYYTGEHVILESKKHEELWSQALGKEMEKTRI